MLQPGTVIDRYEVVAPIAGGGMGMVYRVRHVGLGGEHAMKVLLPNYASSEKVRARFRQEAQVQSRLLHPGIVHVSDLLQAKGLLAMVMDLVHGPSLEQVLAAERTGPWSLADTMAVMDPVLDAMTYAHGLGVAHRDLKPANVMLERSTAPWPGQPRVTDFGLAKLLASEGGMTKTGAMMGTLPYMAPEQFRGSREIDARADVFALGMMLWRLLSGRLPVNPDDMVNVAFMYAGNEPVASLDAVVPGIEPSLAAVVARCLSIDATGRPHDAGALCAELSRAGAGAGAGRGLTEGVAERTEPAGGGVAAPATRLEQARLGGEAAIQPQRVSSAGDAPNRGSEPPSPTPDSRWWQSHKNWALIGLASLGLSVLVRMESGTASGASEPAEPATANPARKAATSTPGSDAGIEWVRVAGGTFWMGSNDGDHDEKPVHQVTLSSFELAKSEVTVGQYRACVSAGKCRAPNTTGSLCNWGKSGRDAHPVNCVDWDQAVAFSRWVGGRLPTEAEWEYAAGSGDRSWTHPWGNEAASCQRAVMNDGASGCGRGGTWPVCSKPAGKSHQGLCDMIGNVWEWTYDSYGGYSSSPQHNPTGASGGSFRVLRGCGWGGAAGNCRAALRRRYAPSYRINVLGFRPSRSIP